MSESPKPVSSRCSSTTLYAGPRAMTVTLPSTTTSGAVAGTDIEFIQPATKDLEKRPYAVETRPIHTTRRGGDVNPPDISFQNIQRHRDFHLAGVAMDRKRHHVARL